MKKTFYFCDICEKEVDTENQSLLPYHDIYTGEETKRICWNCYDKIQKSIRKTIEEIESEKE